MLRVLGVLVAVLLVLSACGGGDDDEEAESVTADSSTSTTAASTTTTADPPPPSTTTTQATPEPTEEATPTPTDADPGGSEGTASDLALYLADLNDIAAALIEDQALMNATGGGVDDLAGVWIDAHASLESLDPPEEAMELHAWWLALSVGFVEAFETFAANLDGGPADQQRAVDEFTVTTAELGEDSLAVDKMQADLTIEVLETRDDPMAQYVLQTAEITEEALPINERMFAALGEMATDPVGALETILGSTDDLTLVAEAWATVDPPPSAEEFHKQRLLLFDTVITTFEILSDAMTNNTDLPDSFVEDLQVLSLTSQLVTAESSRLVASVLRDGG